MDANMELQKLRSRLLASKMPMEEVNVACDNAAVEISNAITDAVAAALQQAEILGIERGAHEFIAGLQAISLGSTIAITTDSGRTDYSEPPFPMMSSLLRNAKTAKDGSKYKHIPLKESKPLTKDSYGAQNQRQMVLDDKRQQLNDLVNVEGARRNNVFGSALSYSNINKQNRKTAEATKSSGTEGAIKIRTVSSKQDAKTRWVRPAKEMDLTSDLMEINSTLQAAIDNIVNQTMQRYGV